MGNKRRGQVRVNLSARTSRWHTGCSWTDVLYPPHCATFVNVFHSGAAAPFVKRMTGITRNNGISG